MNEPSADAAAGSELLFFTIPSRYGILIPDVKISLLLVPTSSSKDHLEILAEVANMLSDNKFIDELRHSTSADQLYEGICSWVKTDSKIAD